MLNKLQNTNTSWGEFFLKFPIVFFVIMPVSMGGCFWIGFQLDSLLGIHIFKMILPVVGSIIGIYLTTLFILLGHTRENSPARAKYSLTSPNEKAQEISGKSVIPNIPKAGHFTAFQR